MFARFLRNGIPIPLLELGIAFPLFERIAIPFESLGISYFFTLLMINFKYKIANSHKFQAHVHYPYAKNIEIKNISRLI